MNDLVIYIHGKGGTSAEADHYAPLFPNCEVIGFDYQAQTPWAAADEFQRFFDVVSAGRDTVYLIANSIGAFFSLCSLAGKRIRKAFFISPVVDMERLICDMMQWADVSEEVLRKEKEIPTSFGETLSWEYLSWVRKHPIQWNIPTEILCGADDRLQSPDTIRGFAEKRGIPVTVMEDGEHWFHTEEQMRFLDAWLRNAARQKPVL